MRLKPEFYRLREGPQHWRLGVVLRRYVYVFPPNAKDVLLTIHLGKVGFEFRWGNPYRHIDEALKR